MYWILNSLVILKQDISIYKLAVLEKLKSLKNSDGGFGGGFMQKSHLAPTYAAASTIYLFQSLDLYQLIGKLYSFILSLKQPNGSFRMCRRAVQLAMDLNGVLFTNQCCTLGLVYQHVILGTKYTGKQGSPNFTCTKIYNRSIIVVISLNLCNIR